MARVFYIWGLSSGPGGKKFSALRGAGHEVHEPTQGDLPYPKSVAEFPAFARKPDRFDACVAAVQRLHDAVQPDAIVGSSLGGAVAMNLRTEAPRVLIAPAWRALFFEFGRACSVTACTVILHSKNDEILGLSKSRELLEAGEAQLGAAGKVLVEQIHADLQAGGYVCDHPRLVVVGKNHRCNDPHPDDGLHPHHAMTTALDILLSRCKR